MNTGLTVHHSPKRKRSHEPTFEQSPSRLNTTLPPIALPNEEPAAESPRTKVASRFETLNIDNGTVSKLDLHQGAIPLNASMDGVEHGRKRTKLFDLGDDLEIPETPHVQSLMSQAGDPTTGQVATEGISNSQEQSPTLARAYPSINRLALSVSRKQKKSASAVDALQSAHDTDTRTLTWQDNEITGHNLTDPDDDGEGINGIGFKPTAAQAELRAQRRRQQLAEYRARESKDARARRSEKRRGSPGPMKDESRSSTESTRKVKFSETNGMIKI